MLLLTVCGCSGNDGKSTTAEAELRGEVPRIDAGAADSGAVDGTSDVLRDNSAFELLLGDGQVEARETEGQAEVGDPDGQAEVGGDAIAPEDVLLAKQIRAGSGHACMIDSGGSVYCWGRNSHGQLGDGTVVDSAVPVAVAGVEGAIQIAIGSGTVHGHTCVLEEDGDVLCWGSSYGCALGNGILEDSHVPIGVGGLGNIKSIGAYLMKTCAVDMEGGVWCWGRFYHLDYFLAPEPSCEAPSELIEGATDAVAVSVGATHACMLKPDGTVWCWGQNDRGQLGSGFADLEDHPIPEKVSALQDVLAIAIDAESCALVADGSIWCWGEGWLNWEPGEKEQPCCPPEQFLGIEDVALLDVGCAVTESGNAFSWGYSNGVGQLGNGSTQSTYEIVQVQGLADVVSISGGIWSSCAVTADGSAWCWGLNSHGQVGSGEMPPDEHTLATPVGLPPMVSVVAAGASFSIGVDGAMWCWGGCDYALTGSAGEVTDVPQAVTGFSGKAVSVAGGGGYTCAVLDDGTVWCSGYNLYGQLGDGTTEKKSEPVQVLGVADAVMVAAGHHACAVTQNGTVWCWGSNCEGDLGTDMPAELGQPVQVTGLTGAVEVAVGGCFSCARLEDGTVHCWGSGKKGKLGSPGGSDLAKPVPGILDAVSLTAGYEHTCVAREDGSVWCWGDNEDGQLGPLAEWDKSAEPILVEGLPDVVKVDSGWKRTCGITTVGEVWCWGDNSPALPGDDTAINWDVDGPVPFLAPTPVEGVVGVSGIAVSGGHVCAVWAGGEVKCWGGGESGQLGTGNHWYASPVKVLGTGLETQ